MQPRHWSMLGAEADKNKWRKARGAARPAHPPSAPSTIMHYSRQKAYVQLAATHQCRKEPPPRAESERVVISGGGLDAAAALEHAGAQRRSGGRQLQATYLIRSDGPERGWREHISPGREQRQVRPRFYPCFRSPTRPHHCAFLNARNHAPRMMSLHSSLHVIRNPAIIPLRRQADFLLPCCLDRMNRADGFAGRLHASPRAAARLRRHISLWA